MKALSFIIDFSSVVCWVFYPNEFEILNGNLFSAFIMSCEHWAKWRVPTYLFTKSIQWIFGKLPNIKYLFRESGSED